MMKKINISEGRGYSIPCAYNINGDEKIVCIIVHGFGSNKDSATARMMVEELPIRGIGAISFDLPAHGESAVDGEYLRIENCMSDLGAVEAIARTLAPNAEIVFFASSFGAYITLIYLAEMGTSNRRAFLRAAAVSMPTVIRQRITPEQKQCLDTAGELILNKHGYGYSRDLKITRGFMDDMERYDVFRLWQEGLARLHMVHGEADQTILLCDAQRFAEMFHVPLTIVSNGDHQLSAAGTPKYVLELASGFFM